MKRKGFTLRCETIVSKMLALFKSLSCYDTRFTESCTLGLVFEKIWCQRHELMAKVEVTPQTLMPNVKIVKDDITTHAWVSKERYSIKCGSVATATVMTI